MTKGMTTWKCPQFFAKDIAVCQTKLNNRLTYLVILYLNGKIHDFPNKFKELIRKKKVTMTLSFALTPILNSSVLELYDNC